MGANGEDKLAAATELLKKVAQNPESVSNADKKQIKKLIGGDTSLIIRALQNIAAEQDPNFGTAVPFPRNPDDGRTDEEIIAGNYIALAKFAIRKLELSNIHKLKVQDTDTGFVIYALTPEPVELDIEQFCTSDYPNNKELLLEAEALQADLFMEDNTEKFCLEITERIENAIL